LQRSGQSTEALAAYQRAGQLFGDLGNVVERVRSLRSAAWLQFWAGAAEPGEPGEPDAAEPPGVTAMRAVLSELESLAAAGLSPELETELTATGTQLGRMLAAPGEDDDDGEDEDDKGDEDGGEPDLPGAARALPDGRCEVVEPGRGHATAPAPGSSRSGSRLLTPRPPAPHARAVRPTRRYHR